MQGVQILMGENQFQPSAVILQAVEIIRCRKEKGDAIVRQRRGEAVGEIIFIGEDDLGLPRWLPMDKFGQLAMHPLRHRQHRLHLLSQCTGVMENKVLALQGVPLLTTEVDHGGVSRGEGPENKKREKISDKAVTITHSLLFRVSGVWREHACMGMGCQDGCLPP